MANGFVVAAISFTIGAWLLGVHVGGATIGALAAALVVSCFACAGLGLCLGALGLRGRSVTVFADSIGAALLIVSGANVPLSDLPNAVQTIASYVPLTHGLEAVRDVAGGTPFAEVSGLLGKEFAVGAAYLIAGLILLRYFEYQGRRSGSFDRS
jgi:ABC-2 type transport system permease protein